MDQKQLRSVLLNHLKSQHIPRGSYLNVQISKEDQTKYNTFNFENISKSQLADQGVDMKGIKSFGNISVPQLSRQLSPLSHQTQLNPKNQQNDFNENIIDQKFKFKTVKTTQPKIFIASSPILPKSKTIKDKIDDERQEFYAYLKRKWKSKHDIHKIIEFKHVGFQKMSAIGSAIDQKYKKK
ncbi:UNKNOWN [Stylonychia lemnae]|uniref:Uncharacterized protein n=1 Tax=Stylonychia lemnae TaxID=5949 RepID=A0A077ZWJ3_STYLE|nr:UNKNOWN [Stylonychia lemnae]|eukprot:CDW73951.1 UNKNOWN [Stylonychia lemnae]